MSKKISLALCALLLGGCSMRLGSFTMASTKNLGNQYTALQRDVSGEDCTHLILFIPVSGSLNPSLQEAVDRAVAQVPNGDMMTNVTVYRDILFTEIYTRECVRVDGDVVSTASASARP